MTNTDAQRAYRNLSSALLVELSYGYDVTLRLGDLDWLTAIHLLTPQLPLPEGPYTVLAVPNGDLR